MEKHKEFMNLAVNESMKNYKNKFQHGGPFGAVIVKDGKVISSAHNTVIESKDATAHAEINAIREASKVLDTHNLSECVLYTSCEPCPMCLSAIIWANIKEVYYANTKYDANRIGFKDNIIYDYLKNNDEKLLKINRIELEEAKEVFKVFENLQEKELY